MARKTGRIPVRLENGQNAPASLLHERFGKLLIIAQEPGRAKDGGYTIWRARCDCGREIVRPSYRFLNKHYGMKQCPGCAPLGRPRLADQAGHVNEIFGNRRRAAHVRGLEWALDKPTFRALCESNCHYCGTPPVIRVTRPSLSGRWAFNGIDRMDSAQGYVRGNVVACCWLCNRAKGDMAYVQFIAWLDQLTAFRSKRTPRRKRVDHPELDLLR